MSRLRSLLLTTGAVVGTLCLLVAVAGLVAGVKPLLFRSGSMGPAIPVGSLALAHPVAADELRVGDVVSVLSARGTRVTHRIVDIAGSGEQRTLTLQGDANETPDPETYPVSRADRVFWSAPLVGYAVAFLGSQPGLFLLGGVIFALLVVVLHRDRPRGGKRRAVGAAAPLVAAALVAGQAAGTAAAFSDTASLGSGTVGGYTLVNVGQAATPCTARAAVLGLEGQITVRWTGVTPPAQPRPQLADYEYVLRFFNRTTNVQAGNPVVVQHSGAAGAEQSYTQGGSALGNLLGLNLLSTTPLRVEIRARLKGTTWESAPPVTVNFTSSSFLTLVSFSCT